MNDFCLSWTLVGTAHPSTNIPELSQLGVQISYQEGDLEVLRAFLRKGEPCIVFVRTGELPYWYVDTDHAVVVVGYDKASFIVHDPASSEAARCVSEGELALSWLEFDYEFAVLRLESRE